MTNFRVDGCMKVKTLKENFKKEFGATLRVYRTRACKSFADDDCTLSEIRAKDAVGGLLTVAGSLHVGRFEAKIAELYGIGVQVANKDNTALADNGSTLIAAGK